MAISVLGTTEAAGAHLTHLERVVVAALAVTPGTDVPTTALAEACWGEAIPATWNKQLQSLVGRIRRAVGDRTIETRPSAYRLRDTVQLDTDTCAEAIANGRMCLLSGEPDRAVDHFERALALWRGAPFADLPDWAPARAAAAALEEQRRATQEDLLRAHLACGEHRSAAADAERLVRQEPLRESRWALLALAKYRSGRQSDALAGIREARRLLTEEGLDPSEDLSKLERAILRHDPSLDVVSFTPRSRAPCPYRGLQAFGLDDAALFFGRAALVAAAEARLERAAFLVLTGVSGSGKSSVALAGVAARARAAGRTVSIVRPGGALAVVDPGGSRAEDLIVIDQFEEIFLLTDAEISALCHDIDHALRGGKEVLVTVRSDFLDRAASLDHIGDRIAREVLVVPAMTREELRQSLEEPARRSGLRLEAGLTELVLRDASGITAALPLMSHALAATWARREGSVLTVEGYESSGGCAGAIARSADDLLEELDERGRRLCRDVLLRLVERGPEGQPMRRRLPQDALEGDGARRDVVARLTRARLVSAERDGLVIAHEAIATAWPTLGRWLDERAEDAEVMLHLSDAARAWAREGKSDEDLLRGSRLDAAEEFRVRTDPALTPTETAFLDASITRRQSVQARAAAARDKERRQNHRLRAALVAMSAFAMASIVAASVAAVQSGTAVHNARVAEAAATDASLEALLGQVDALRQSRRDVAALLAAEISVRYPDDPRSRAALASVLTGAGGFVSTTYLDADSVIGAAIPGTDDLLVIRDNRYVTRVAARTGRSIELAALAPGLESAQLAAAVSGDGRVAAIAVRAPGTAADVVIVDIERGVQTTSVTLPAWGPALALNRDGSMLASAAFPAGALSVADVESGEVRTTRSFVAEPLPDFATAPASVVFSSSGEILLADASPRLAVIDPVTLEVLRAVPLDSGANAAAAVTADGIWLGAGDIDVHAVDLARGVVLWSRPATGGKPQSCAVLAASSALGVAFCGDSFGRIEARDLRSGELSATSYDPQLGRVGAVVVTERGDLVAVGGSTPTLSRWRLDGGGAVAELIAPGRVAYDGFEGAGERLLMAPRPDEARVDVDFSRFEVWDPSTDRIVRTFHDMQGMGWAGTGLLTAFVTAERRIAYFDATTGREITRDAVPLTASHLWAGASGTRSYLALEGGEVRLVDAATARFIEPTLRVDGEVFWVSADGTDHAQIAVSAWSGDGLRTTTFHPATGEKLAEGLPGAHVTAFLGEDRLVAAVEGEITVHDARTLEPLVRLPGARGQVNSLQVSQDGRTLLATSNDGTASLYDARVGVRLGDPIPVAAPLIVPAWLRGDGAVMAATVAHGVQLWDLRTTSWRDAVCRIAGRALTEEERATYFPGDDDREPACTPR